MSSQSVIGGDPGSRPGEAGYMAEWVYQVVPDHVPWSVWNTLETCLGNMLAHDFLMMVIGNDADIKTTLARRKYTSLPGQRGSAVGARRSRALARRLSVRSAL